MNNNIEKLVKVLDDFNRNVASFAGNEKYVLWDDHVELAKHLIANEVAPIAHGEWIVLGDGENVPWMCSHCCKTTAHKYKILYGNYCPNCGAKMDWGRNYEK